MDIIASKLHLGKLSVQRLPAPLPAVHPSPLDEKSPEQAHHYRVWVLHAKLKPKRVKQAAFRDQNLGKQKGGEAALRASPQLEASGVLDDVPEDALAR